MTMSPATGVGYVLIGTYFNVCLLGLSFVQAYLYYTRYGRDPWGIKSVVLVLLACDIANTVCVCTCVYLWLVTHYGQVAYLNEILPSFLGALQSTSITTAVCQLFFAWRVQVLRKQWWLTAIIVFFCASGLIGSMATVIGYAVIPEGAYFTNLYVMQPAMLVWSCCFVTCDSITTGTLVYTLRKAVQGFHSDTDSRIESIKNLVLQTSSLTMVVDMIHLLIVAIRPDLMAHFIFSISSSKLSLNSLMSTLNTRSPSAHMMGEESHSAPHHSRDGGHRMAIQLPTLSPPPREGTCDGMVHITTVQEKFSSQALHPGRASSAGNLSSTGKVDDETGLDFV